MPKTKIIKASPVRVQGSRSARKAKPSNSRFFVTKSIAPEEQYVSLKYGDVWDLSGGAVDFAQQVFRLNSLFDPDNTGVGGQPSGFDYWSTAFYRYKVLSVDVTVVFTNTTNTLSFGALTCYGGGFSPPSSGTEVQQSCLEGDHTKHVLLAPANSGCSFIRGTIKFSVDLKTLVGRAAFEDMEFSAAYSANPGLSAYMQMAISMYNGTTVGPAVTCVVQITYNAHLTQRRALYED